jgi:hypothetical protein
MAEYRISNIKVITADLHTSDVGFDIEKSDDGGETWDVIDSEIETIDNRLAATSVARQIHLVANEIAHKNAMITDTIDAVLVQLEKMPLGPKAFEHGPEMEPLEL